MLGNLNTKKQSHPLQAEMKEGITKKQVNLLRLSFIIKVSTKF